MTIDKTSLIQSGADYFSDLVQTEIEARGISISHSVADYMANVLAFYIDARNLHEPQFDESGRKNPQTLAEMWLMAQTAESSVQRELLKKLGDRTLYVSGFFSESLNRSLVDVEYYHSMGASAYRILAESSDSTIKSVFGEISERFLDLVEVLNGISHDTFAQTYQGILRLYETYLRTGSNLAREKLLEIGVSATWNASFKKQTGH